MANGEPIERVIDRIEAHILRVEQMVGMINTRGCAHRPDDLRRVENLERWRDRGIIGVLSIALTMLAAGVKWLVGR